MLFRIIRSEPTMQTTNSPASLASDIKQFVHAQTDRLLSRYLPSLRIPRYFAGHRIDTAFAVDLMVMLTYFDDETFAGRSALEVIAAVIKQIDAQPVNTFVCYRLGETIAHYGTWDDNAILRSLPDEQIRALRSALDPSYIYQPHDDSIGGHPNNYWCVLLRGLSAMKRLGLIDDPTLLNIATERSRQLLLRNPQGYFDDDRNGGGAYDIYSADVLLFVEPLWDILGRDKILSVAGKHVGLLEQLAMPNGACINWGRSIGALSICLTIELASMAIHQKIGTDASRLLALARRAFEQFRDHWMQDDLISAHRNRMTFGYRGPHRLLQMTADCLYKLAYAAQSLSAVTTPLAPCPSGELYPDRDELIRFDDQNAGVWMYRKNRIEFQLPFVGGRAGTDYVPSLRAPELFENPVDSPMLVGVPRVLCDNIEYTLGNRPSSLSHSANSATARYDKLVTVTQPNKDPAATPLNGSGIAKWTVEGDAIAIQFDLQFDRQPQAIHLEFSEATVPLNVKFASSAPFDTSIVPVQGQPQQRSFWNEIRQIHQIEIAPDATSIQLSARIVPAVRVAHIPADHDYNRALYDAMPAPGVLEYRHNNASAGHQIETLLAHIAEQEIFHIGWPEHLLSRANKTDAEIDDQMARFVGELDRLPVKIVWTMHNRRPHGWDGDRGIALYRLWAPVVDCCLHHSRWGEKVMCEQYPFRADCRHEYLPHGAWVKQMRTPLSRDELLKKYKVGDAAIRFGVFGRYQPEKQIELIAKAFSEAARDDQQLLISAWKPDTQLPDDPRIIKIPRADWLTRDSIAEHVAMADCLVAAQTGDTYLTSGVVGDSFAAGIGLIAPDWTFYREIAPDCSIYHDNSVDGLTQVLRDITSEQIAAMNHSAAAKRSEYDFENLAPKLMQIFRSLRS